MIILIAVPKLFLQSVSVAPAVQLVNLPVLCVVVEAVVDIVASICSIYLCVDRVTLHCCVVMATKRP